MFEQIVYHYRGLKHKRAHLKHNSPWTPFQSLLQEQLEQWRPKSKLIILGGSGGYLLDTNWLYQFERIVVIDHDPLTSFFFNRHHPLKKIEYIKANIVLNNKISFDLISNHDLSNTSLLFSNILGQLPLQFINRSLNYAQYKEHLKKKLIEKSFFSFHDLYSMKLINRPFLQTTTLKPQEKLDIKKWILKNNVDSTDITDHETSDLFSSYSRSVLNWHLRKDLLHLIEVVRQ